MSNLSSSSPALFTKAMADAIEEATGLRCYRMLAYTPKAAVFHSITLSGSRESDPELHRAAGSDRVLTAVDISTHCRHNHSDFADTLLNSHQDALAAVDNLDIPGIAALYAENLFSSVSYNEADQTLRESGTLISTYVLTWNWNGGPANGSSTN